MGEPVAATEAREQRIRKHSDRGTGPEAQESLAQAWSQSDHPAALLSPGILFRLQRMLGNQAVERYVIQRASVIDAHGVGHEEDENNFTTDAAGRIHDAAGNVVTFRAPDGVYVEEYDASGSANNGSTTSAQPPAPAAAGSTSSTTPAAEATAGASDSTPTLAAAGGLIVVPPLSGPPVPLGEIPANLLQLPPIGGATAAGASAPAAAAGATEVAGETILVTGGAVGTEAVVET
ncbi:MAG: hypothetical protein JO023_04235, partial [Chloroflexi bacterium]|nr:hypothetical protein [Chloroflexota bacterium]